MRAVNKNGAMLILASAGFMGFLATWEDGPFTQNVVYQDALAGVPTACLGITAAVSPVPVIVGDYWSAAKCSEIATKVVENTQMSLLSCITRGIPQPVFDALSSHAHNFGVAQTCASRALGLINEGRTSEGCDALAYKPDGYTPAWSYVGTKYVRGLFKRRLAERQLCMRGVG